MLYFLFQILLQILHCMYIAVIYLLYVGANNGRSSILGHSRNRENEVKRMHLRLPR
jgi:hypothetical protein